MFANRRLRALIERGGPQLRRTARLYRDAWTLLRSGWFDVGWYRATYADVGAAGVHPIKHYLLAGAAEGRDPGPRFSTRGYLRHNPDVAAAGINPLLHFIRHGRREGRGQSGVLAGPDARPGVGDGQLATLDDVLHDRFRELVPLRTVRLTRDGAPRVTMLTDSISAGSLFGGTGTAVLLCAELAKRLGGGLRIVTETEPPTPGNVGSVFAAHGIDCRQDIEFCYAPRGDRNRGEVAFTSGDLFVTTSWWTTWNARQSVPARQILYLLQEDERMFYPYGDLHLRCGEVLADPDLRFVVNSRLLFEHLVDSGLDNIARSGVWFEPAFPRHSYHWPEGRPAPTNRRNFLFYARPWNSRNLYTRGLEAIGAAIQEGVLDPDAWNLIFAGRDLGPIILPREVRPRLMQNLPWTEYVALVRSVDVGLTLMYTPHPSYPPLDLAASGAVAVTNRFGRKTSLDQYSRNIICVPADVASLVDGIAQGTVLAADEVTRRRNYENSRLGRDWTAAFAPVLDHLFARAEV
jgi:hypothetical protein